MTEKSFFKPSSGMETKKVRKVCGFFEKFMGDGDGLLFGAEREFCAGCVARQYSEREVTPVFTDHELKQKHFQADFRLFLVNYTCEKGLRFSEWHDHLCELYRDYPGWMRDVDGREVFLDMGVFEVDHIREWFRDYIQLVPDKGDTRLRAESKERIRAFASIMRSHFPQRAMMWGVRAANDN